jgi:predicted Fe-S protein YdhL (DUF1289 family)
MRGAVPVVLGSMAVVGVLTVASAQTPTYWAVTGVRSDDVLHLRDVPSAESRSLARIPPNARGLKHLGCRRNQPPMDQWVRMSEAQRREALTQWCRVEFRGKQGWVAGRYLKKDTGPAR